MSDARVPLLVADLGDLDQHDTGSHHPERPARLRAVRRGIEAAGLRDAIKPLEPVEATMEALSLAHDEGYVRALERFIRAGGGNLDPDTVTSEGSWRTALLAAGSGLAAIEALQRGEADAAFVAVRPPGHHATSTRAMGFCLLNNVAVSAAALAAQGERVVVVDWDVHHGNGTEQIFWDDPRVLYVSTHQSPAYPGTGRAGDVGGGDALGLTVNVPLPPGSRGDALRAALDDIIEPAIDAFGPTWVLISAGFDAHRDDPLADLEWTAGDYAHVAARIASFAPAPGRVVAFLEGGYDLDALSYGVGATLAALVGQHWSPEPESSGGPGREVVAAVARARELAIEKGLG